MWSQHQTHPSEHSAQRECPDGGAASGDGLQDEGHHGDAVGDTDIGREWLADKKIPRWQWWWQWRIYEDHAEDEMETARWTDATEVIPTLGNPWTPSQSDADSVCLVRDERSCDTRLKYIDKDHSHKVLILQKKSY